MPARPLRSVPDQPGRVVLYTRVSAVMSRSVDEFHSPELQEQAMRRMASTHGLREVAAVQDIDKSGRTFSREGLDQVRKLVETGEVDVVAVADLSRLGRNAAEALAFVRWLRERGVSIISTKEQVDDTPEGAFMLGQFLGMAQLYSDQMARRWSEVIAYRAQEGKAHGTPPIGYVRLVADGPDGKNGRRPTKVVDDPVLGPAMRAVFQGYAAGKPIVELARYLSKVAGRPVSLSTTRRALHNPFFLGQTVLWGLGRHRHPRPWDEPLYVGPGDHPALVDQATWDDVQRRLKQDSKTVERRHLGMAWSLAGLIFCSGCQFPLHMHHSAVGRNPEKVARLRCGATSRRARSDCDGVGTPYLEKVEDAVLEELARRAARLRADPTEQAKQRSRATNAASERDALRSELADGQAQQARLVERWIAGKIPDAAYEANLSRLTEAEAGLRERLAELADAPMPPEPGQISTLIERVFAAWPKATGPEKRVMLAALIRRVEIRRPTYWREPVPDRIAVEFVW